MNQKPNFYLIWSPQPGPQTFLFKCPVPEIFFGGSRGGGKTDGVLGKWGWKAQAYGRGFNGIVFRPTMPSQDDAWERAHEIYGPAGAVFHEQSKSIKFPGGGRIRFRPLERIADADKYIGQNVSDSWVEEAGLYPSSAPIDRLHGILRSPHGVPTQLILTGNPGGAGQHWIKTRYVGPAAKQMALLERILPNGSRHRYAFIPSKLSDNRILLEMDPGYPDRLYLVGSAALVRAWLDGDWDAVEGAFFECWSPTKHIVPPFELPKSWPRYMSMDWGSAVPFSVGWWAIASDRTVHPVTGQVIPRGCAVRYREWYGMEPGRANIGLKLTAEQVADGIRKRENDAKDPPMHLRVIDPATFARDGGPSLAERLSLGGVHCAYADNTRVSGRGAMAGWDLVRARLIGLDNEPMMVFFSTCTDSLRTLPVAQHDEARPEDLDTASEDHALDDIRYFCASRPWIPPKATTPLPTVPKDGYRPKDTGDNWKTL